MRNMNTRHESTCSLVAVCTMRVGEVPGDRRYQYIQWWSYVTELPSKSGMDLTREKLAYNWDIMRIY